MCCYGTWDPLIKIVSVSEVSPPPQFLTLQTYVPFAYQFLKIKIIKSQIQDLNPIISSIHFICQTKLKSPTMTVLLSNRLGRIHFRECDTWEKKASS